MSGFFVCLFFETTFVMTLVRMLSTAGDDHVVLPSWGRE